jgi:hypothetical protein
MFQRDVDSSAANLTLLYNCNTEQPNMIFSSTCDKITVVYTLAEPTSITRSPTIIVEFPVMGIQAVQLVTQNNLVQALDLWISKH